jgi:hypothetical protein
MLKSTWLSFSKTGKPLFAAAFQRALSILPFLQDQHFQGKQHSQKFCQMADVG